MFAQRIFIWLTLLGFVSFTAIEFFPFTLIGFEVLTNKSIETELIMLQLIFRHGERAPLWQYPTDPNNQSFWNRFGGLGELTDNGKKQCYNHGVFLREIYGDFLSPKYDEKQVMMKSTPYLRIVKTAQLIVSGLYKPKNATNWNEQSAPLPTPNATLHLLWAIPNCARYDQLLSQVLKSEEFNKSVDYYKDTINAANKYSGNAKNDIFSLGGISDTVSIEKANNLTLPKWVQEHYHKIQQSSHTVYHFIYRTPEMAKYITGRILNDINMNILKKIEGHLAPLQLVLYSSHDTLVAPLIKQLGLVENTTKPEFLATVFMELRRVKGNGKSKFFVQVLLKDNEPDQPINLRKVTIAGCDELCPLEDFERIISNKVVIDMVKECSLKP